MTSAKHRPVSRAIRMANSQRLADPVGQMLDKASRKHFVVVSVGQLCSGMGNNADSCYHTYKSVLIKVYFYR